MLEIDRAHASARQIAQGTPGLDNIAFDSKNRMYISNIADGSISEVKHGRVSPISSPGLTLPASRSRARWP